MPSLLPYLLLGAVAVVLFLLALPHIRRTNLVDEVKRFDHARALTTTWSERARDKGDAVPPPAAGTSSARASGEGKSGGS